MKWSLSIKKFTLLIPHTKLLLLLTGGSRPVENP